MKHILVHLDASTRSADRLTLAQGLAREHQAALTALYAVVPTLLALPFAGAAGAESAYAVFEQLDREQRGRARALFERQLPAGTMAWAETGNELFESTVLQHALLADLLVLGQVDPQDGMAGAVPPGFIATLLTDSGKPALILPHTGRFQPIGREVLLAWKPTREAARAATAALPWLRQAKSIHLACDTATRDADRVGSAAVERWLRLNGVTAPMAVHGLPEQQVGEALLSLAADASADLLVMGCYGHNRLREWVLGGATRTVLDSMTLPVLMAH
ncbi:universal stress protein [Ideonella azotifigens]|uniref:Universal stress protein n=2 Tax=Ideonella azotifigens TaxID=513160 RepID=A0ABN1K5S5_9BURK|nr:universal stress protein [Ideonella azotifigens]MCD2344412.1 universal stress protein [Ideonella azotifigens]